MLTLLVCSTVTGEEWQKLHGDLLTKQRAAARTGSHAAVVPEIYEEIYTLGEDGYAAVDILKQLLTTESAQIKQEQFCCLMIIRHLPYHPGQF